MTRDGHTTFSPALATHPRRAEIEAHEAVHRAQFDNRGRCRLGTRAELEAEAVAGAAALRRGRPFVPALAAPQSMVLADSPSASVSETMEPPPWSVHDLQAWLKEELEEIRRLAQAQESYIGQLLYEKQAEQARQRFCLGMQLLRLWDKKFGDPPPGSVAELVFKRKEDFASPRALLRRALQLRKSEMFGPGGFWYDAAGSGKGTDKADKDLRRRREQDPFEAHLDTVDPADKRYVDQMAAAIVHGRGEAPEIAPAPAPVEDEDKDEAAQDSAPSRRRRGRGCARVHMGPLQVTTVPPQVTTILSTHSLREEDFVSIANGIMRDLGIPSRVTSLSQRELPTKGNTGVHAFRQVAPDRVLGVIRAGEVGSRAWVQINIVFDASGFHRISYHGVDLLGRSRRGVKYYDPMRDRWR